MIRRLLVAATLLAPVLAHAASPTQGAYAYDLGVQYGSARFISSMMMTWFDPTNTAIPSGAPRPVSTDFPMPVTVVGGGGGSGGSTPTANAGATSTTAVPVQNADGSKLATAAAQALLTAPGTVGASGITVTDPATQALQNAQSGSGLKVQGTVADSNSAAFQGETAMTVGTTYTAGRSLKAICTTAGAVSLTYANGSTGVWMAAVGMQVWGVGVTTVNTSGTTAVCTYGNLL